MSVGANEHEIASVLRHYLQTTMNQENARQILTQIRKVSKKTSEISFCGFHSFL